MNPTKIITEAEFKKQKEYEADMPINNNDLEDFDIPVLKDKVKEVEIKRKDFNNLDEDAKKLEVICNIFDLRGVDYVPDSLELENLLSKSYEELKEIEEKLKNSPEKKLNLK